MLKRLFDKSFGAEKASSLGERATSLFLHSGLFTFVSRLVCTKQIILQTRSILQTRYIYIYISQDPTRFSRKPINKAGCAYKGEPFASPRELQGSGVNRGQIGGRQRSRYVVASTRSLHRPEVENHFRNSRRRLADGLIMTYSRHH